MPGWPDPGRVLSRVALRFPPGIDISLLSYRIGVGDQAASQEKGRGAGRQVALLSFSGMPTEYVNVAEVLGGILAELLCLLLLKFPLSFPGP